MAANEPTELQALDATRDAYTLLEPLNDEQRQRALSWIVDALGIETKPDGAPGKPGAGGEPGGDSGDSGASDVGDPKKFLASKQPKDNAQTLAVLGYLLAHEGTPTYKKPNLEEMNARAAGHRIANLSRDLDNATRGAGYFTTAADGNKQLTDYGERVVEALPNQEAVKQLSKTTRRPRRRTTKKKKAAAKKTSKK